MVSKASQTIDVGTNLQTLRVPGQQHHTCKIMYDSTCGNNGWPPSASWLVLKSGLRYCGMTPPRDKEMSPTTSAFRTFRTFGTFRSSRTTSPWPGPLPPWLSVPNECLGSYSVRISHDSKERRLVTRNKPEARTKRVNPLWSVHA
jgi:hypothetical protein